MSIEQFVDAMEDAENIVSAWSRQELKMLDATNPNPNLVDLGKKLLDACRNGETEEVRSLMQSGAPFTTDWLGTSPLHFSAHYGHAETTEVLLRAGVSRDTRTKVDRTPLHVAAQEGHLAIVNMLIMHGADIDAKDLLWMTPLHWAVERGHTDVVECLLANGADPNITSRFDKRPIDVALDIGRIDLVPILQVRCSVAACELLSMGPAPVLRCSCCVRVVRSLTNHVVLFTEIQRRYQTETRQQIVTASETTGHRIAKQS